MSQSATPQEAIGMRYVGVVIQELWSEQRPRREREHHRGRPGRLDDELPGPIRRLLPDQRSRRT